MLRRSSKIFAIDDCEGCPAFSDLVRGQSEDAKELTLTTGIGERWVPSPRRAAMSAPLEGKGGDLLLGREHGIGIELGLSS